MARVIPTLQGRGMTMSDQLGRWARTTPDAWALRFEGSGRTYADLDERVTRLASCFQSATCGSVAAGRSSNA